MTISTGLRRYAGFLATLGFARVAGTVLGAATLLFLIRALGVETYGFTGSHPDDDPMLSRAHGTDESVGISSLVSSTKSMIAIAWQMCNAR